MNLKELHEPMKNWERDNPDMDGFLKESLYNIRESFTNGDITIANSKYLLQELAHYTTKRKGITPRTQAIIEQTTINNEVFRENVDTFFLNDIAISKRRSSMNANVGKISKALDTNVFYESFIPKRNTPVLTELIFQTVNEYEIPKLKKGTIFLESTLIALEKCDISEEDILKDAMNMLIIHSDYDVEEIQKILDSLKLYKPESVEQAMKILDRMTNDGEINELLLKESTELTEDEVKKIISRQSYKGASVLNDMIVIGKSRNKDPKIKRMLDRIEKTLYSMPVESVIDGAPDTFRIMRRIITYTSLATINPLLVILGAVLDSIVENNANIKYVKRVVEQIDEEIEICNAILKEKKYKINPKERNNVELYIEELINHRARLQNFIDGEREGINIFKEYSDEDYNRNIGLILAISEAVDTGEEVLLREFSLKDSMHKAKEKLRNAGETLSAKDKMISKQIDSSVDKFTDSFEQALALENREKVIKGKVLPNASKTIKLGIATGAAWAIAPASAVVVALSSWALSKGVRDRERQIVLDEIRVHLKIVEKKIQQADMNNDIEAVEELMKLEGQLKREEQRIVYRQKAYRR